MSGALTVEIENRAGRFKLVDDHGNVAAYGVARPSVTRRGYTTLTYTRIEIPWTPGTPIRVPVDWLVELDHFPVPE